MPSRDDRSRGDKRRRNSRILPFIVLALGALATTLITLHIGASLSGPTIDQLVYKLVYMVFGIALYWSVTKIER